MYKIYKSIGRIEIKLNCGESLFVYRIWFIVICWMDYFLIGNLLDIIIIIYDYRNY